MSSIDPHYFESKFKILQETHWDFAQLCRVFDEDWTNTQICWDDNASSYVRDRYISIIQEDDVALNTTVTQHANCMQNSITYFYKIQESTETAYQQACEAETLVISANQELQSAEHALNVAQEKKQQSLAHQNTAHEYLHTADRYVSPR